MTYWPEPEKTKIPEGHYQFRLNKEPELKKFAYTDKQGNAKEGRKLVIYAIGLNETGEYPVIDAFAPWDDRYRDLCAVLGVEHGKDIHMIGAVFNADIKHEADKKDSSKSWPRIVNITVTQGERISQTTEEEGDDIPF